MTDISVQTENIEVVKEAVESYCNKVRFGSEFCEQKVPSLEVLEKAYSLANDGGKAFVYITPRVSNRGLKRMRSHLDFLNKKGKIDVVVNDFGVLNMLEQHLNLRPHLGRQLIYVPARCPWKEIVEDKAGFLTRRRVAKIFHQTSLNYIPTIRFYQSHRVQGIDIDWLPKCFPYFNFLMKNGLNLSVHLYFIPVTITRRCHTARFLGEKSPESCSKPCYTRTFLLKHEILDVELFLQGNAVFILKKPTKKDIKRLYRNDVSEFVITINPSTKIENQQEIDALIQELQI